MHCLLHFQLVFSLFTNISLEETIHLSTELLFKAKPDLKISRKDLQKPFQFATSQINLQRAN